MLGVSRAAPAQFSAALRIYAARAARPRRAVYKSSSIYTLRTGRKETPACRLVFLFGYLGILKCSAEVNSASAKVLPAAKRLYGAKAPPRRAGPRSCPASIVYGQDIKITTPSGVVIFMEPWEI